MAEWYLVRLKAGKTAERGSSTAELKRLRFPPLSRPPWTSRAVTPSRRPASILLMVAAFGLAGVGITMNGWFARSLGLIPPAGCSWP
jgi:hypothetical protein